MSQVDEARHGRQILLPEIGRAGQARIAASRAAVGGDTFAHEVAARYALRAGFSGVAPAAAAMSSAAVATGPAAVASGYTFFSREAAAVHDGARAALAAIREAIAP